MLFIFQLRCAAVQTSGRINDIQVLANFGNNDNKAMEFDSFYGVDDTELIGVCLVEICEIFVTQDDVFPLGHHLSAKCRCLYHQ